MWRFGIVFLIALSAAAQQTNSYQIGDSRLNATTIPSGNFVNHHLLQNSAHQLAGGQHLRDFIDSMKNDHSCFAIRSYIFRRDDDRAPVLVKTLTCTPNRVRVQQANSPKARLVPAN